MTGVQTCALPIYAPNGKFAWVEINGEDYGWTREGRNVGKYRIVMVEK